MSLKGNNSSFLIVAFFVTIIGIGIFIFSVNSLKPIKNKSNPNQPLVVSSSSSNLYETLSPASVPSRTIECKQAITYSTSGVPGPYQCPNGALNITDWKALAALEPSVLNLGYSPSSNQVQNALCNDVKANISNPIEETVYSIASLYYGWHFSSNPESIILNGTCHNIDD